MNSPAFSTAFYNVRPQQIKRKKPPAKKRILEQEVKKRVPLSAWKDFGAEQDGVKQLAALAGQLSPVKEELLDPPGDPQPNSLLEEPMTEEKDLRYGAQGTEKPADDPQLTEHDPFSGGRKSPSPCNTLDQSTGEDTSRETSQLSAVEFTEVPNTKAEDDDAWDLITCFCMKPFAGRPMIECNECATWIHLSCAKIRKSNVPDIFICQRCRDAKQEIRRPRSCPGDTQLSPHLPVPMTIILNWVLSYLHIWLLWDHSWGQGVGQPPVTQQPPGSSLCLFPPVESLGPKSALCFYSYFVL
ncbi:PHD finger protein 13 [Corvus brachyrhynchos]|uniref:PHD finger protein 13 n=1 Tax=Corvus brachyrhynchos TaxID=85066 RepID=A0A091EDV1_CORBR|nr:PHD finger protein 13 [Corvus brachyrhynchos]